MKRKALDQQLELMVGHANKLSEMVQEGLIAEKCCSRDTLDDGYFHIFIQPYFN